MDGRGPDAVVAGVAALTEAGGLAGVLDLEMGGLAAVDTAFLVLSCEGFVSEGFAVDCGLTA